MDCAEVKRRLSAWVDDELPAGQAQRIERHLQDCPACRLEAREQRQLAAALNALPAIAAPSAFSRKTMRAFQAGVERPSLAQWWRQMSMAMRGAVCATALAGLLCGVVLGSSLTSTLGTDKPAMPYQTLYASNGILP